MLNFGAFCDESETDGQVFCVSGFVASEQEWGKLESQWVKALDGLRRTYNKPFEEFKMYDCVAGENDYMDLLPRDRDDIQRRFIGIINSIDHIGVCAAVNLREFNKLSPVVKRRFSMKKYEKPYLLAFAHVCLVMGKILEEVDQGERLAAVFDQTKEYQGRAKELWDDLKRQPVTELIPVAPRLGGISFEDSKLFPGLQAADILAYETRRYFREVIFNVLPCEETWQWRALNTVPIDVYPIGREALKRLYRPDHTFL